MDKGKPNGKGNPRAGGWKRPSGGDSSAPVRCYKCGEPGHRSVTTSFACLDYPIDVFDREFGMDLTVIFPEDVSVEDLELTARQVKQAVEDGAAVFMLIASLEAKGKAVSSELPVVCDFLEDFPEDVRELPPEREVEFAIEMIPGTSHVLMAPYRMSTSKLAELKSQLE
ncbi:uncharacterized protein LOC131613651 [Vicia villosa]|uniref:uncharacterized protein LOC131613651 n=1 Tax=Vicia villosa TaxID=3911 RepID=UPI00273C506C|nr:uncharacterized protein LOC131613651 [Vicia villosa]